jgi:hypothetical protein
MPPAWDGNGVDDFFVGGRTARTADRRRQLPAITASVRLPFSGSPATDRFVDLLGSAIYDRAGADLAAGGLFLDLPPWGFHVFDVAGA